MQSLLTILAFLMLSLLPPLGVVGDTNPTTKFSCCVKVLDAQPFSETSLFHLDSVWTNDAADPVKLSSFQGRPHILTMFFTTCAFACPTLVNDMKRIEAALPQSVRTNVGFVLISFDTDRDTPAALAAYRARHCLSRNWTLLHGGSDDVLEIAALLGIKFKKNARGDFAHSNVISLLDNKGEIVLQQIGLNRDPDAISSAVKNILKTGAPCEGASASGLRLEEFLP